MKYLLCFYGLLSGRWLFFMYFVIYNVMMEFGVFLCLVIKMKSVFVGVEGWIWGVMWLMFIFFFVGGGVVRVLVGRLVVGL